MFSNRGGLDALLERKRPSVWQQFFSMPAVYIAKTLYSWRSITPAESSSTPTTAVCISDTHNSQPYIPPGDILIHAGDLIQSGSIQELQTSIDWLNALPHKHKIVVAGNHDLHLDPAPRNPTSKQDSTIGWGTIRYLRNCSTELKCAGGRTVRVYGSPWSIRHGDWASSILAQRTYGATRSLQIRISWLRIRLRAAIWT